MAARAQLPGISAVPIWGDDGGGGPTPPSDLTDHFEASIIVGNVPNGDPAVAQVAPFRYIPDDGDGAGIEAALLEASALSHCRIRLRPGQYFIPDTIPLFSVPAGTRLEGSGAGVGATLLTRSAGADVREVFQVYGELAHLTIQLFDPSGDAPTGEAVVTAFGDGVADNVDIYVEDADAAEQELDSLRSLFSAVGAASRIVDCRGVYAPPMSETTNPPQVAVFNTAPITSGPATSDVVIRGITLPGNNASQVRVNASAARVQVDVVGTGAATGDLNGTRIQARLITGVNSGSGMPAALFVGGTDIQLDYEVYDLSTELLTYVECTGTRVTARVSGTGTGNSVAVDDSGADNQWWGTVDGEMSIDGSAIGVVNMRASGISFGIPSTNCIAVANRLQSEVIDNGTGNEVANNVVAP